MVAEVAGVIAVICLAIAFVLTVAACLQMLIDWWKDFPFGRRRK